MPEYTISRSTLLDLVDWYPNPEDDRPWGPWGPVMRQERLHWLVVAGLNPQPLPPKEAPPPRERWGSHPDPWGARVLTHALLHQVAQLSAVADAVGGGDVAGKVATSWITWFVDDWCGNGPRPVPGPFPPPWQPLAVADVHPANLLAAAAQFHRVAEAAEEGALHDAANDAAERLIEAGLARMERRTSEPTTERRGP